MAPLNPESKLAKRLIKNDLSFPEAGTNYFERFTKLDEFMNEQIHPIINQGASAHDGGWLTDHGKDHIATVIRRASEMLFLPDSAECVLTPYECYILLVACHFHDVGNVFGREKHEQKITEVMAKIDAHVLGDDNFEKRLIRDIAMAHGGYVNGDPDTIGRLSYPRSNNGTGPRAHLLAAILRLADELADDSTRTKRFLVNQADPRSLLKGSEIYHHYADRLRKVEASPRDGVIKLRFELDVERDRGLLLNKCQKGPDKKYLLDEIFERALKMHHERVYCTWYMQPLVHFAQIDVSIQVCDQEYMQVLQSINFTMKDSAYPITPRHLDSLCPDIGVTSASLRQRVRAYKKSGVY